MRDVIIVFLFISSSIYSQSPRGSAVTLKGTVKIEGIFVNSNHSSWSEKEIDLYTSLTYKNMAWLSNYAKKYNNTFSFSITTKIGDFILEPCESSQWNSFTPIIKYLTNNKPYEYYLSKKTDNLFFIFFVRGHGRAYSVKNTTGDNYMEYAVIFSDGIFNINEGESVIAHETLHVFGANDLYDDENKELTDTLTKIFPLEIMRICGNLEYLKISPYTANTIGWIPLYNKEFAEINRLIFEK